MSRLALAATESSVENPPPAELAWRVDVAIDTPAHAALNSTLSYASAQAIAPGSLVRVPLGRRETLGVVWASAPGDTSGLKAVVGVLDALAPLGDAWRALVAFAARYYQRSLGEVALAALPPALRSLTPEQLARRKPRRAPEATAAAAQVDATDSIALNDQQTPTIFQFFIENGWLIDAPAADAPRKRPVLLWGATGSGKTEVYLQIAQRALERHARAQVLLLVPEINLTPQLESRVRRRFAHLGIEAVASLHSGLTPPQRLSEWRAAHAGTARVVLGTRTAVFASMPHLALIVVDEEHDPSYKSQDGARFSARDLAVWRAKNEGAAVMLGSATPSLESWHAAETGRYLRLAMPARVGGAAMPALRLLDLKKEPKPAKNTRGDDAAWMPSALVAAIQARIARGEQSLVLLNRRGYAPVLRCGDCEWTSECPHCDAHRVFHKLDRTLRCHHCAYTERVPRACPSCGSLDLHIVGKGTERLEESLETVLIGSPRADGSLLQAAHIERVDADATRHKDALDAALGRVHRGEVDVLVGTQMLAKGHDFRRITLVAALGVDAALFSSDYRAQERLFALLLQVGGRAGRDAAFASSAHPPEVWIATHAADHPIFKFLQTHDYAGFATAQLREREAAGLPPFAHQALLRADAKTQAAAHSFLNTARAAGNALSQSMGLPENTVVLFAPVPLHVARVAGVERAHLLVESRNRSTFLKWLSAFAEQLPALAPSKGEKRVIRHALDVDPWSIS